MGTLDGEFSHNVSNTSKVFNLSEYRLAQAEVKLFSHTFGDAQAYKR